MPDKNKRPATLQEKAGIPPPDTVSAQSAQQVRNYRRIQPSAEALISGIIRGDKTALSRAITLIESTNPDHFEKATTVINGCLPHANRSVRIGITGVPGVGKSTFIEAFGSQLTAIGRKVAVLAVDPSSTLSHGSILGDKTRMEELVKDERAYIRPSASGEALGGVARKTREAIILCEAAGFDIIVIETVGVGQSETAVHSMTDFFLLLKISGAGDELQGIKRGIMEMADAIVINKADGDNIKRAQLAKTEFNRALHLFPAKDSGWQPTVSTCSAVEKTGIGAVWETISEYLRLTKSNGFFEKRRAAQNQYWMMETIERQLKERFFNNSDISASLDDMKRAVQQGEISPFAAARLLLEQYFKA
ncbi:methylmalonyl Co-A mutase-associated GTPase MeaB [Flavobacterium magnum]|uniref:Methylmalonyl Co-A mutase-associated GTPase MeaB n=1 Tax=Flavobacterium magnum TaxID=2162713 RepID=A0A2S0RED5_9FLAO|nr:methylmalonyl Co-A mutase-associated GTPase MeaB [Flavobacterium magnum]AWA29994.1 methylmalonyl Co-A mutase-associated GTPase MeaB [Flavobacterium magnum]